MIVDQIAQLIGNTPLVNISKIVSDKFNLWAKLEYFNPGGSMKDRVSKFVLNKAKELGYIRQDSTIIIPTSGNLGVSMAMLSIEMGYKCICIMEEGTSYVKRQYIEAFGGRIVTVHNDSIWSAKARLSKAYELEKTISNSWVFNQYDDLLNHEAHYHTTGEELLSQAGDAIDVFIAPVSTGGTISGISKKIKEKSPTTLVIGVEPMGSVIFGGNGGDTLQDGSGLSFITENLKMGTIDGFCKVSDVDSFTMARKVAQSVGLFIGDSSAAAVVAAEQINAYLSTNKKLNIVVLMPDNGDKYIETFYDDNWIEKNRDLLESNKKLNDEGISIEVNKKSMDILRTSENKVIDYDSSKKIYKSVLDLIGNTPLLRIHTDSESADVYLKLEKFNPGGSAKDRTALSMVVEAENKGILKPGMKIAESSSGNTGVALAMIGTIKGYPVRCIVETETSVVKKRRIAVFGADFIEVPADPYNISAVQDRIKVALKIKEEEKDTFVPFQYGNSDNPLAHYHGTGKEIIRDLGLVDCFISNISTGGTITGISKVLKEVNPNCKVIGVEPVGSTIFGGESSNSYIEGAGLPFVPPNLDIDLLDEKLKVDDATAFFYTQYLSRKTGVLVGSSSGALIGVAFKEAKRLGKGKKVVVMVHDGGERYLDTVFNAEWLESKNIQVTNEVVIGG